MNNHRGGVHVADEINNRPTKLSHDLVQGAEMLVLGDLDKRPPPRVAALANILMVSERVLRRAFQDTFGVPPNRYLRTLRLSGARRALLSRQDRIVTVTEIATLFRFCRAWALLGGIPCDVRREPIDHPSHWKDTHDGKLQASNRKLEIPTTTSANGVIRDARNRALDCHC